MALMAILEIENSQKQRRVAIYLRGRPLLFYHLLTTFKETKPMSLCLNVLILEKSRESKCLKIILVSDLIGSWRKSSLKTLRQMPEHSSFMENG